MIELKILSENTTYKREFISTHGLSMVINFNGVKILFDFGQKEEIFPNAKLLGENLKDVEIGILSHGHYDHSGGIKKFLEINKGKIIAHPGIFKKRFSRNTYIGMDETIKNFKKRFILIENLKEIFENFYFLGEIKRYEREDESIAGFFTEDGKVDRVEDDSSILFKAQRGWVLICGCCHSGLFNTIKYIKEKMDIDYFHALIGGFHLKNPTKNLNLTLRALSEIKFEKIYPMHCTGFRGMKFLIENFPEKVNNLNCGEKLVL